jgi:MoxR-like ATPase
MFKVQVDYPSLAEEREILRRTTANERNEIEQVLNGEELIQLQTAIREMPVADEVFDFVLALARGTRVRSGEPLDFIKQNVSWGAGPRAGQNLILGAKAHAAIRGRNHVASEDVRAVAHPVLRHRIVTSFSAQAEGITSDMIIDRLLDEVQLGAGVGAGLPGLKTDN